MTILACGKRYGDRWWRPPRNIVLRDALNQHVATFGQPGSGKSVSLYHQMLQHIRAHRPFFLFDTHSDLYNQALTALVIHGWKPENVILINPADRTWGSPGIDLLECAEDQEPFEVVSELIGAFKAIWWESWGARMEDIFSNCLLSLQESQLTLSEAERFLTDETFRDAIVQRLENLEVKAYWHDHFGNLKETERRTWVESSRNKISSFLAHPAIRSVFSQVGSTVRFADAMNQGKAVLINLSRNHLKEARGLFGALLLAKISLAILSRESIPPEKRIPVTLYCDEQPEYFLPQFCLAIAAGSRKFGISYRVFAQSPAQYREHIDVLLATCGTTVAFNLDSKGAERLARELFTFTGRRIKVQERDFWGLIGRPQHYLVQEEVQHAINELTTQHVGECYIRIRGKHDTGNPYIATVPHITFPTPDPEAEAAFAEASARIYYRSQLEIDHARQQRLANVVSGRSLDTSPGDDLELEEQIVISHGDYHATESRTKHKRRTARKGLAAHAKKSHPLPSNK